MGCGFSYGACSCGREFLTYEHACFFFFGISRYNYFYFIVVSAKLFIWSWFPKLFLLLFLLLFVNYSKFGMFVLFFSFSFHSLIIMKSNPARV